MPRIRVILLQELVIAFGFLNGLWVYSAVNPQSEVLFTPLVPEITSVLFWVGVILLTAVPLAVTYVIGRRLGVLAVLLAFIGGLFVEMWGLYSLVAGMGLGLYLIYRSLD